MTEEELKTLAKNFFTGEAKRINSEDPEKITYTYEKNITSRGLVTAEYYLTIEEWGKVLEFYDKIVEEFKSL